MNLETFLKIPVTDCHIHYPHINQAANLLKTCDELQINQFNIVCTPHQQRMSLVPDALRLKAQAPERIFVFGGLDVSAYFRAQQQCGEIFAGWMDLLAAVGCDGIKMIEGKPDMRRMLPIPPFDSPAFAPFWEKMAVTQTHLLFHVNDPEEFWDAARIPPWAKERGWYYGDGSYINNEKQYEEIFHVLANNPDLKVIFAHFFFLSAQLPRLAELLERYPNVNIDLTPGIEMYRNFSGNIDKTRDFFIRYQDRILFGTDIGARALLASATGTIELPESRERVTLVRNFLENPGEFTLTPGGGFLFGDPEKPFHGLGLPEDVLHKIYHQNFARIVSATPRPFNPAAIVEMCHQIERMIEIQGSSQPGVSGDSSVIREVRTYFESAR